MVRELPLSRGEVALVDDEDFDRVAAIGKWYANPSCQTFYARKNFSVGTRRAPRYTSLLMHTLITGWALVDHVNHNGLDNRRANLRQATEQQNSRNRRLRSDNTTGYKGVSFRSKRGDWTACIWDGHRTRHLGRHSNPISAAIAYDVAARQLFGEFAHLNFPVLQEAS
jgi:AP2 domain/HNH endonuclease